MQVLQQYNIGSGLIYKTTPKSRQNRMQQIISLNMNPIAEVDKAKVVEISEPVAAKEPVVSRRKGKICESTRSRIVKKTVRAKKSPTIKRGSESPDKPKRRTKYDELNERIKLLEDSITELKGRVHKAEYDLYKVSKCYVYFITENVDLSHIRIGISKNPQSELMMFQLMYDNGLTLLDTIEYRTKDLAYEMLKLAIPNMEGKNVQVFLSREQLDLLIEFIKRSSQ